MTEEEARIIAYHRRRRDEERQRARQACHDRVRQAHLDLAKLHDFKEVFALVPTRVPPIED